MDTVIAYRVNGGKVNFVMAEDGMDVCVFPHQDAAIDYADRNALFQSGQADYQIITLDEI